MSRPPFPVSDDRVITFARIGTTPRARVVTVCLGDRSEPLPHAIRRHSPDGFEWGYVGSGPSDLALNILLLVLPREEAERFYFAFRNEKIAHLNRADAVMTLLEVRAWVDRAYDNEERTDKLGAVR